MPPTAVFCTVCNNQKFKSEAGLKQHIRDSASHRERVQQQKACTVCAGKIFKDLSAYNNHVRNSKDHRARAAQAGASIPVASTSKPASVYAASSADTSKPVPPKPTISTPSVTRPPSSPTDTVARGSQTPPRVVTPEISIAVRPPHKKLLYMTY